MTGRKERTTKPWTPEQLARMFKMRAQGHSWPVVAAATGHSLHSCSGTYCTLRQRERRGDPLPGRSALDKRGVVG